jgi:hypothetical protein
VPSPEQHLPAAKRSVWPPIIDTRHAVPCRYTELPMQPVTATAVGASCIAAGRHGCRRPCDRCTPPVNGVDYAGQTVEMADGNAGELRTAQVFVAVLGASNYTYAEASWTQSLPDWISSHVRTLEFLGGVPRLSGLPLRHVPSWCAPDDTPERPAMVAQHPARNVGELGQDGRDCFNGTQGARCGPLSLGVAHVVLLLVAVSRVNAFARKYAIAASRLVIR